MAQIRNAAQAEGPVLANDAGDAPAPDVADAVIHGEIRMIGWVAGFVTVALHDVRAEVGDGLGMVDPDGDVAVVLHQFVERTTSVAAGGREIAVGMQAVDMAALDQSADFLAVGFGRVPIGKLAGCHVEVDRVPNFQTDAGSHGGFLSGIEEAHQLEVSRRIGRLVEVAADGEQGGQEGEL